jgi:hypothetical protein
MTTLIADHEVFGSDVIFTDDAMTVLLDDGRSISVPLTWFPRLLAGNQAERINFEFIGAGTGIHWSELDEDISIEGLVAGRRSAESPASLSRWMESRNK